MDDDSQSITTLTRGQIHLGNSDECDQQRYSRNRHQPSPAHSVSIRDHTIHVVQPVCLHARPDPFFTLQGEVWPRPIPPLIALDLDGLFSGEQSESHECTSSSVTFF